MRSATSPRLEPPLLDPAKFRDPHVTADGERRASVRLTALTALWINTGTLCNLACRNCYIESSPTNDRLAYITAAEVAAYFDEIHALGLPTREIGFTGGEPFMNPDFLAMLEDALARGFRALVLTNAMRPMMRHAGALLALHDRFGDRLVLRVSIDHYTQTLHELERGPGAWDRAIEGLVWLVESGFTVHVAGRTCWAEAEAYLRAGYARLFGGLGLDIDADDPAVLVLLPEMERNLDVPEITVDCWNLLGAEPAAMMCAFSRMVVKRKGAERPTVVACTLLPDEPQFDSGPGLAAVHREVALNHPNCARFCVLGGGSCGG